VGAEGSSSVARLDLHSFHLHRQCRRERVTGYVLSHLISSPAGLIPETGSALSEALANSYDAFDSRIITIVKSIELFVSEFTANSFVHRERRETNAGNGKCAMMAPSNRISTNLQIISH
jgi:hypothetical protein